MHAHAHTGRGPRERTALEELGGQVGARVDAAVVARELGLVRVRAGLGVGVASRVGVEAGVTLVILFLIWLECASVLSMITSADTGGEIRGGVMARQHRVLSMITS